MFKKLKDDIAIIDNQTNEPVITDLQSALDLIASAWYSAGCAKLVIMKEDLCEEFFDLKTGLAGAVLQKFVNYNFRVVIVGDFETYTSSSLKDFIFESNKGKAVCFVSTVEEAADRLSK